VGVWRKGKFAFCTGEPEQKHRNLDSNAQVAVATGGLGAQGWNVGLDVVVEGRVTQVTEADELQILADAWFAKYGDDWKWTVRGDEFVDAGRSADSDAGGAQVFVVTPATVIVFGNAHGQTTYKF
jgi:hypothetical protein